MAFNPSPEVGAARDFARKFGADRVIIVYLAPGEEDDYLGYATYGSTKLLCDEAEKLADVAFDAIRQYINQENQ